MKEDTARGSAKLGPMSVEELQRSIATAKEAYRVKRWIIKGIPPVYDRVDALLDVTDIKSTGQVVQGLVALQTPLRQVGVVVFPYGIPFVDGALLNVDINLSSASPAGEA